jgi:hypothetical protein
LGVQQCAPFGCLGKRLPKHLKASQSSGANLFVVGCVWRSGIQQARGWGAPPRAFPGRAVIVARLLPKKCAPQSQYAKKRPYSLSRAKVTPAWAGFGSHPTSTNRCLSEECITAWPPCRSLPSHLPQTADPASPLWMGPFHFPLSPRPEHPEIHFAHSHLHLGTLLVQSAGVEQSRRARRTQRQNELPRSEKPFWGPSRIFCCATNFQHV